MVPTLAFLAVLSAQADGAPRDLRAAPPRLDVTFTETEGPGKPLFSCVVETDLPDGCLIQVYLHFDRVLPGAHLSFARQFVRDGRVEFRFDQMAVPESVFPDRNLSGTYHVSVTFDPAVQRRPHHLLHRASARKSLTLGDAEAVRKDRHAVRLRLARQIRKFGAIARNIEQAAARAGGRPDPAAWKKLTEGWVRECRGIEHEVFDTPEYRALRLGGTAGDTEQLRAYIIQLAHFAGKPDPDNFRRGRVRIQRTIDDIAGRLTEVVLTRPELVKIAGQVLDLVEASEDLEGDGLDVNRREVTERLLELGSAPQAADHKRDVMRVMRLLRPAYEAFAKDSGDSPRLRRELEDVVADLVDALRDEE